MIYMIEDDHHVRKALGLVMKSHGYECITFSTGEEFLSDQVEKDVYDILILDLNMADFNGKDFLKKLISLPNPVTVIGITAQDEVHIRSFCRDYGVKALLTKPVDSNALIDLIKYHGEMHSA